MAKKSKRTVEEEEGSSYSWMDTYGDMVTLLLCFFVLLYSFCSVDAEKWKQLVEAFTGSSSSVAIDAMDMTAVRAPAILEVDELGGRKEEDNIEMLNAEEADSLTMEDLEALAAEEEKQSQFDLLFYSLRRYIEENQLQDEISVDKDGDIITIRFVEILLFESGKADLLEKGRETLGSIIELFTTYQDIIKTITVEGHTDNVPINNEEFPNNWALSSARAMNTLYVFTDAATIDFTKLSFKGYGEYQPIDTNDTEEGRARNRRVDFVVERIE